MKQQTIRATRLEAAGLAVCIQQDDLSASVLAHAIETACKQDRDYAAGMLLDGATASADIVREHHAVFKRTRST